MKYALYIIYILYIWLICYEFTARYDLWTSQHLGCVFQKQNTRRQKTTASKTTLSETNFGNCRGPGLLLQFVYWETSCCRCHQQYCLHSGYLPRIAFSEAWTYSFRYSVFFYLKKRTTTRLTVVFVDVLFFKSWCYFSFSHIFLQKNEGFCCEIISGWATFQDVFLSWIAFKHWLQCFIFQQQWNAMMQAAKMLEPLGSIQNLIFLDMISLVTPWQKISFKNALTMFDPFLKHYIFEYSLGGLLRFPEVFHQFHPIF